MAEERWVSIEGGMEMWKEIAKRGAWLPCHPVISRLFGSLIHHSDLY